ncbi:MAG: hypothetical protein FWF11_03055, partial [Coriobacteriia bacterium]|nr:hypothetical protein [Coriobacteriia bacterium]
RAYLPRESKKGGGQQNAQQAAESVQRSKPAAVLGSDLYQQMFLCVRKPLLSAGNALYRASALSNQNLRFKDGLHHLEDVLFNAQFFATDLPILLTAQPFYGIRVVPTSQSRLLLQAKDEYAAQRLTVSYRTLVQEIKQLQKHSRTAKKNVAAFWVYRLVVVATILRAHAAALLRK